MSDNTTVSPIRLGLCSKLDQKKPSCVLMVKPTVNTILDGASKKLKGTKKKMKGKRDGHNSNSNSNMMMIRRATDGKQISIDNSQTNPDQVLDWLQNGDSIFVGPSLLPPTQYTARLPQPPTIPGFFIASSENHRSMTTAATRTNFKVEELGKKEKWVHVPSTGTQPRETRTPIQSSRRKKKFPILEDNILHEVRQAIAGCKSFEERASFVPQVSRSFVSFDYGNILNPEKDFADPSEKTEDGQPVHRIFQKRLLLRRECRGLIVDSITGHVLARRLHKFWTIGEREESRFEQLPELTDDCILTEKIDGSLVTPFLFPQQTDFLFWATKRVIHSGVKAYVKEQAPRVEAFARHCILQLESTPIFEWVDPNRPVIIRYDKPRLMLLAIRHMRTGTYMPDIEMRKLVQNFSQLEKEAGSQIRVVPRLNIDLSATDTLEQLVEQVSNYEDCREGCVLRFPDDTFVKLKTKWYLEKQALVLEGCSDTSTNLAHFIRRPKTGVVNLQDVPLSAVLTASLTGTMEDAFSLLRSDPVAVQLLHEFNESATAGLQKLHERFIDWGRTLQTINIGSHRNMKQEIAALVYGDEETLHPWSARTLHAYGKTGFYENENTTAAAFSEQEKNAKNALVDDLRCLVSKRLTTQQQLALSDVLGIVWPQATFSGAATTEQGRTLGSVCPGMGISWDSDNISRGTPAGNIGLQSLIQLIDGDLNRRLAIILRGLPGTGKSTLSTALLNFLPRDKIGVICSADNFQQDYNDLLREDSTILKKKGLIDAHKSCLRLFRKHCNNKSTALTICDNTNVTKKELKPYLAAVEAAPDIDLVIIELICGDEEQALECQKRNLHGVTKDLAWKRFHEFETLDKPYAPFCVRIRPGSLHVDVSL